MEHTAFVAHFTEDKPGIFAHHGYARAIHGRANVARFHVRGFSEEGTTTTPFDMVVRNKMSRYHLCIETMRRAPRVRELTPALIAECDDLLASHDAYVRVHLEDLPEIAEWVWTE